MVRSTTILLIIIIAAIVTFSAAARSQQGAQASARAGKVVAKAVSLAATAQGQVMDMFGAIVAGR